MILIEKKSHLAGDLLTVSENESMVAGNMAAGRQAWPESSS